MHLFRGCRTGLARDQSRSGNRVASGMSSVNLAGIDTSVCATLGQIIGAESGGYGIASLTQCILQWI